MTRRQAKISIPAGVKFADLQLARTPDGGIEFDAETIRGICRASNLDESLFFDAPEDNLSSLLVTWYATARANGEPQNPVMDEIAEEMLIETLRGQNTSHKPGRA